MARLPRIRRPNPARQGRKVKKKKERRSPLRKKFCIPVRTALADMWRCVRNRLLRSVTISRKIIPPLPLSCSLSLSLLCVQRRQACIAFAMLLLRGRKAGDTTEIDPRARAFVTEVTVSFSSCLRVYLTA